MALETEVKIYVPHLEAMQTRLENSEAVLHRARLFERNIRYEDRDEGFAERGIVLRLRQDDRVRLTYKERAPQQSSGTTTRLELETEVADFDVMDAILRKLGYSTGLIYEKYRTTYILDSAEIVLDEMPYGNFIEIEGSPEAIEAAIQTLEMGEFGRILGSYVYLFGVVKQALNLDFRDLTFENFADVQVPGSIFA